MSQVGKMYDREINGVMYRVEYVTIYMGIYINPINGFTYAVDWKQKHRAAFQSSEAARKWCDVADTAYAGLPETNAEFETFHDALKTRGWRVVQLLGDCQVWEVST